MKIIEIGDLHVQKSNLEESRKFILWLVDLGVKVKAKFGDVRFIFMGDQFNDFGIARVEVVEFWTWAAQLIATTFGAQAVTYLVGNHDRNSEGTDTAMVAFSQYGNIIDKESKSIFGFVGSPAGVGFLRDNDKFSEQVMKAYNEMGARLVYCHQEFHGAMFESGTYAPHGVDPTTFPSDLKFRVGHFHKKQKFGNVTYVGTPRQLTKSDIGETKGVHLYETDTHEEQFIPTPDSVCEQFREIIFKEGDKIPAMEFRKTDYVILEGTKEWCEKAERKIPSGTKLSCSYTDIVKEIKVKESDGIPLSFKKFYDEQQIPEHIKAKVLEKILEACPQLRG